MAYQNAKDINYHLPARYVTIRPVVPGEGKIHNTGRVERVLTLIKYLQEWHNLAQIADYLKVSRKSVHRYINLLVKLGFKLEHRYYKGSQYRITNLAEYFMK